MGNGHVEDAPLRDDGSAESSSGTTSVARIPHIRSRLKRFNYVTYPNVGSNLDNSLGGIIGRVLSPAAADFTYVTAQTRDADFQALFVTDDNNQIPAGFQETSSFIENRWVYFMSFETHRVIEVHYRSDLDWDVGVWHPEGDGYVRRQNFNSQDSLLHFSTRILNRSTRAIALPSRVTPVTAEAIFADAGLGEFCRIPAGGASGGASGSGSGSGEAPLVFDPPDLADQPVAAERAIYVFDPAHIVRQAVSVIQTNIMWTRVIDARERPIDIQREFGHRLSPRELERRMEGITAIIAKQLLTADSDALDAAHTQQLDRTYRRYTAYGKRRAMFIDTIYNFLAHDLLCGLETALVSDPGEGDTYPGGSAWLQIVAPLAEMAGEHELLMYYFDQESQLEAAESPFSTFFHAMLSTAEQQETVWARAWARTLRVPDFTGLMKSVAELKSFQLLDAYTSGRQQTDLDTFRGEVDAAEQSLRNFTNGALPASVRQLGEFRQAMAKVHGYFSWAKRLGGLRAVFDNPATAGAWTNVLDSLSEFLKPRSHRYLKLAGHTAVSVKNVVDLCSSSANLNERIGMQDYDAALGHGLAITGSVMQVGYTWTIIATTSLRTIVTTPALLSLGGPAGVVASLLCAVGAIIILFATDSETEVFLGHSQWGPDFGEGDEQDWSDGRLALFQQENTSDSDRRAVNIGLTRQFNSLMNLVHRYTVKHSFSSTNWVLTIQIEAKFFPDTARFVFKGEFQTDSESGRVQITLQCPVRAGQAAVVEFRENVLNAVTRCNSRVFTENNLHKIQINMTLDRHLGIRGGRGWLQCFPFSHEDIVVPYSGDYQKNAFNLENLYSESMLSRIRDTSPWHWRTCNFDHDEWARMPRWEVVAPDREADTDIDLSGEWRILYRNSEHDCSEEIPEGEITVTIRQRGNIVEFDYRDDHGENHVRGTLDGTELTWRNNGTDGSGRWTGIGDLTVSPNQAVILGRETWTWRSESTSDTCRGTDGITALRNQEQE